MCTNIAYLSYAAKYVMQSNCIKIRNAKRYKFNFFSEKPNM